MKDVFYNPPIEPCDCEPQVDFLDPYSQSDNLPRRTSGASSVSGYCSEGGADRDRSMSGDSCGLRFRPSRRVYQQQSTVDQEPIGLSWIPESTATESGPVTIIHNADIEEEAGEVESATTTTQDEGLLGVPTKSVSNSGSADTLIPTTPMSPSNLSSVTLVGSTGSGSGGEKGDEASTSDKAPTTVLPERVIPKRPPRTIEQQAAALAAANTVTTTTAKITAKPPTSAPPVIVDARKLSTSSNISTSIIVTTPSISSSSVMPKSSAISPPSVSFDRRPSVGYNVIPHAALCQHRYSLQLNDEMNASKVNEKLCKLISYN